MYRCDFTTSLFLLLGSQHQFRPDVLLEFFLGQSTEFQSALLQGDTLLVGVLGHLGGHVVANDGVQAGDKHQTV